MLSKQKEMIYKKLEKSGIHGALQPELVELVIKIVDKAVEKETKAWVKVISDAIKRKK